MDNISFKITGSLKGPFDEISKQMPRIEKRALYHAAYFMRDKIRQSLETSLPASTHRNPKYNDTLVDAVRFTKVDGASTTVHAMGTRQTGSGTYRARFFEEGTKDRYHKTMNGVKLKKKKYIGHIKPLHFFKSAVDANRNAAVKLMEDVITEYVDAAFSKQN